MSKLFLSNTNQTLSTNKHLQLIEWSENFTIETNYILMQSAVTKNSTFSELWPRGELGALPDDAEQYMLIEHLSREFEKLQRTIESGDAPFDRQQALTLDFYRQRIEALEQKVEILKDKVAQIKSQNGAAH